MSTARLRRIVSLVHKARRCPFCGWRGFRFEPFGNPALRRDDAACPICGSLERHRAAFLLLRDRIPGGQKVLHAAPERLMIPWLVGLASEYLNVDLHNPAMRRMDLTDIDLPDNSKTLVWCSHVLEHIPDDAKALSEIYRVLEPGGLLAVQVPIGGQTTFEDPSITTDEARLTNFLQEDHVRLYGLDLRQRIEKAGFECEVLSTADLSQADQTLYGLRHPVFREVFLCRRPNPA
jgi:SAM-dependent methyltransferase